MQEEMIHGSIAPVQITGLGGNVLFLVVSDLSVDLRANEYGTRFPSRSCEYYASGNDYFFGDVHRQSSLKEHILIYKGRLPLPREQQVHRINSNQSLSPKSRRWLTVCVCVSSSAYVLVFCQTLWHTHQLR
jgi:hypothetical protein